MITAMPTLELRTVLRASRDEAWRWITSVRGITREMMPWLRMTVPHGVESLTDLEIEPGRMLFRSWILALGVLPVDASQLTLVSLEPGRGFVEESPMVMMRRWRHERRIEDVGAGTVALVDRVTFEPRVGGVVVESFVRAFFAHRHRVLARELSGV